MDSNRAEIERLQVMLSEGRTTQYWNTRKFVDLGKFDVSNIIIGSSNLYVTVSLPKLFFGDNVKTLTPEQTSDAIDLLCDNLGVDVRNASICHLHIANTFEVKYAPNLYYEYLGESPNLHRWNCTPDTIYYVSTGNKKWKVLYFYDKVKECKSRNAESVIDEGVNLLRMELRLERSPNNQLKRIFLFIKDLSDPLLHRQCKELLVKYYNNINKCCPIVDILKLSDTATPKETIEYLLVELLQKAELEDPAFREKFFILARKSNSYNNTEALRRLRKKIEELVNHHARQDRYSLEKELTDKVNGLLDDAD